MYRVLRTVLGRSSKSTLGATLAAGMILSLVACGTEPEPSVEASTARTYEVRGLVRQLPSGPGSELMIYHEAIPDLVDDRGEVVGMEAMTMSFPVAEPSLLDGIAVGDRIVFDLRLDWEGSPALEITRAEVLPAGTRLDFEPPPEEPGGEADDGPGEAPEPDPGSSDPGSSDPGSSDP